MIQFGSVCSGIEAASVAWHDLGWKAAWLAEIEPFPSAVLKHHYPEIPNMGDMATLPDRILSGEVSAPDLFCGGTPCQAFSVAGLRKSLDDARGNLSLIFCEIANAIDSVRSAGGKPASIVFWENVPGVLSTQDNAFGCFLAGLAGEDDPLEPPGGKWTNAGCVFGPTRAVAWRVLDAQYFGVAQRRRRVFVVASAREGFDPSAVLFEFDGLRRDTAPSREAGQRPAPTVTSGAPFSRTGNDRVTDDAFVAKCLTTGTGQRYDPETETLLPCVFPTLEAQDGYKWGSNQWVNQGKSIVQPVTYDFFNITAPVNKQSREPGDPCHTLARSNAEHAVVMNTVAFSRNDDGRDASDDLSPTLRVAGRAGGMAAVATSCLTPDLPQRVRVHGVEGTAPTLSAEHGRGHGVPTVMASMQVRRLTPVECERLQGFPDNYTAIPWRGKPADQCPDGPRYKALGNSWAVPVVRWIGHRISARLGS
jgi:DNA (cytosine-5)-methyltransferase 1